MVDIKAVLVQSVTEFFPVSSGAHLLLFCKGIVTPELLHLGTVIPVLLYFRKELFKNFFTVALATIPAIIIGFLVKKYSSYTDMQDITKWGILLGALFMLFAELTPNATQKKISLKNATLIGFAQCLAFIPGFSRLGSTLSAGRLLGYDRVTTATFGFLLSMPTSLGAVILAKPSTDDLLFISPFIIIETIIGYISLWAFMKLNSRLFILLMVFYRLFLFWMLI